MGCDEMNGWVTRPSRIYINNLNLENVMNDDDDSNDDVNRLRSVIIVCKYTYIFK